jgi:nucleoside-diphosphate-sugar epimerase
MIFVTGGTGLVGRHLLTVLAERRIAATALARSDAAANAVKSLGATPFSGSADDPATWARVGDCSAIVHCAALITAQENWEAYRRSNVESVRLAAARARQLGVPLVHLSSVAVYASESRLGRDGEVTESYPIGPLDDRSYYPRSKRLAEREVWEAVGAGLRAVVLRPTVIYGEGDRQFLPRVARIARWGWLPVFGSGDRPMSLIHARNIAHAIVQALTLQRGWGKAYNLVNDDAVTSLEMIDLIGEGMGRRLRALRIPLGVATAGARANDLVLAALSPGTQPTKAIGAIKWWRGGNPFDASPARRELDWHSEVRHREGLPAAARWLRGTGTPS